MFYFSFSNSSPFGFGNRGAPDTPLRMLVPASVVGAIIGKGGSTVRQITQLKVILFEFILMKHFTSKVLLN